MAASWFHPRDLPPTYRALLDPERELPPDVYLMASLPSFASRWAALMVFLPISGFWVVLALQNLLAMGAFSDIMEVLLWTISALFAVGVSLKSIEGVRYAMRARVDHRHGRWRFGVFMHREWLLIRHEKNRALLIPKSDVNRVSEEVSPNGKAIHPVIDLGDNSISAHPVWKDIWSQVDDVHSSDRMKDWFQGHQFNWLAAQGAPPPIRGVPKAGQSERNRSEQDDGEGSEFGTHIPSLPPHKLSALKKSRGVPTNAFVALGEQQTIKLPSPVASGALPSLGFLTPGGAPAREATPNPGASHRRVAPRPPPLDPNAPPIPPTPAARDRIREVLAHAVQSTKLDLSGCNLGSVPNEILRVPHLTYLDLSNNNLDRLPSFVSDLPMLEVLDISSNLNLTTLPVSIGRLQHLRHVQADLTGFMYFPWELAICKALTYIVLPGEPFDDKQREEITSLLPYVKIEFVGSSQLEQESINTPFLELIQQVEQAEEEDGIAINLARKELEQIDIASLQHSRVVSLNASHNNLKSISDDIRELSSLEVLILDDNKLKSLPESLCSLQHLEWISVTNNKLTAMPAAIGRLAKLSQLIVYGNNFAPEERLRLQALFPHIDLVF
jgi:Leucine-rich repeat (LRR) protein